MSVRRIKTRVYLTLQQRFDILQKLENGVSMIQLAHDYNVNSITIRRIRSNAVQIRQQSQILGIQNQKKFRMPVLDELDIRLHSWYLQRQAIGDHITDALLHEKAKELNEEFGGPSSFTASRGWIWRFKRRHGIRLPRYHGECACSNTEEEEDFSWSSLQRLEEEYIELQNFYNMREMGLTWKVVPQKTLVHTGRRKISKKKITKDCTDSTRTQELSPLAIHECKRSRTLKNCRNRLPVIFKAQRNTWMNQNEFADWLENRFKPAVRRQQLQRGACGKVFLLLDNCEAHILPPQLQRQNDNIELVYFSANTMTSMQPGGQEIIERMRRSFSHRMMRKILEFPDGVVEFYANYYIKDCISLINEIWIDMIQIGICKSWRKLLAGKVTQEQTQEHQGERSCDMPVITEIKETVGTIAEETVPQNQIEERLTDSNETEECNVDSEFSDLKGNYEPYVEPDLDEEETKNMFSTLALWSQDQPSFIQLQVQAIQTFYNNARR